MNISDNEKIEKYKEKSFAFFSNVECEYFPCHKTDKTDSFNCLFCYCPLYFLDCGGNFSYTPTGIKDCSGCLLPHIRENYGIVIDKLTTAINEKAKIKQKDE
jgi:Zn-finger protein